jgi:thymidine phosphorylase
MNQPLGNYIGNWLEVYECIKVLQGEKVPDLIELSLYLSGAMIYLGGKSKSIDEGIETAIKLIKSGKAFDKFLEIVKLQGGNADYIKNPAKYPNSKFHEKIFAGKSGYVKSINSFEIGMASLELGAGRITMEDKIDPKAGIIFYPKIGQKISKGELIAELFTDKKTSVEPVKRKISNSILITDKKPRTIKLIKYISDY